MLQLKRLCWLGCLILSIRADAQPPRFVKHVGTSDFISEGVAMADVNGNGHPDLVTGKRYFAHNGEDPGAYEPSVWYWFELKPGASPQWMPHLIDSDSGVGLQVLVVK